MIPGTEIDPIRSQNHWKSIEINDSGYWNRNNLISNQWKSIEINDSGYWNRCNLISKSMKSIEINWNQWFRLLQSIQIDIKINEIHTIWVKSMSPGIATDPIWSKNNRKAFKINWNQLNINLKSITTINNNQLNHHHTTVHSTSFFEFDWGNNCRGWKIKATKTAILHNYCRSN